MFSLLILSVLSDCDTSLSGRFFTSRQVLDTAMCVQIQNSVFERISGADNGGAVFVQCLNMPIEIRQTMFTGCSAPGNGGAICFNAAQATIDGVCAVECSARVGSVLHANSFDMPVSVRLTTVARCSSNVGTLFVKQGIAQIESVNATGNTAEVEASGVAIYSDNDANAKISLSTFYGNGKSSTIYQYLTGANVIESCNFVNNENSAALLRFRSFPPSSITISGCYFISNGNTLLSKSSVNSATLTGCVLDISSAMLDAEGITHSGCTFNAAGVATLNLGFLNTGLCQALNPSGGSGGGSGGGGSGGGGSGGGGSGGGGSGGGGSGGGGSGGGGSGGGSSSEGGSTTVDPSDSHLSAGAIVAIVFACIIIVLICAIVALWYWKPLLFAVLLLKVKQMLPKKSSGDDSTTSLLTKNMIEEDENTEYVAIN